MKNIVILLSILIISIIVYQVKVFSDNAEFISNINSPDKLNISYMYIESEMNYRVDLDWEAPNDYALEYEEDGQKNNILVSDCGYKLYRTQILPNGTKSDRIKIYDSEVGEDSTQLNIGGNHTDIIPAIGEMDLKFEYVLETFNNSTGRPGFKPVFLTKEITLSNTENNICTK